MSLEERFKSACDRARTFSKRPTDADMLELYGLYKQATIGDVNISGKSTDPVAIAKYHAWNGKKGMKADAAMEQYINKIQSLSAKYK